MRDECQRSMQIPTAKLERQLYSIFNIYMDNFVPVPMTNVSIWHILHFI
jgi:hypothetical protein